MGYTIGIDIGGSTTKIVGLKDGKLCHCIRVQADDPVTSGYGAFGKFLSENGLELSQIDKVRCTGVGASFLKNGIYGIPTLCVDEFMAIGLGGRYSSGCAHAIVASMGTGTALVSVEGDKIEHLGGTGVGGGTIVGLSKCMYNSTDFGHIVELAEQGDLQKVDLSIGDISHVQMSNMRHETTAANFGKLSESATSCDLALGVLNMVFQTIGIFAIMAARAQQTKHIVLTGNLSRIALARRVMDDLETLYPVRFLIPEVSEFATAIGAAIYEE